MKLAIVVGGWHWPLHFFARMAQEASGGDLYVIGHRNPELPVVREEKREILSVAQGPLADLDRQLYADFPTVVKLRALGWNYTEAPNICGDWCFFNQWLETHDYKPYDIILNCHDDTYVQREGLFKQLHGDWLLLGNGTYPQAPAGYVRGSFEFWKPILLSYLGGHIDIGEVYLTREGKTDTPQGLNQLSSWNNTGVPLRNFLVKHGFANRVAHLSPYYRISNWVIEAERGFLHYQDGVPWSFADGVKEFLPSGCMADSHRTGVESLK